MTNSGGQKIDESPLLVCAVGASAGGLSPVEEFFDSMPSNTGVAFVVVQHLSPDHESMMVSLLSNHTAMPVEHAVDGEPLHADHVHLISPGTELSVENGRMVVSKRSVGSKDIPKPIDLFFKSMAANYKTNAIAVVLSGTGSDGTAGIETVRRAGGITLAQDGTAAFAGMPTAARESGFVDAVLDPTSLAGVVSRFAATGKRPVSNDAEVVLDGDEERILTYLSMSNDIDFREYKPATVGRRLQRRMSMSGLPTLSDYADEVRDNQVERAELIEDLFIDVTQFFRDQEAFDILEKDILPELLEEAAAENRPFRMWTPGCATGEEAYSLTMLALEAADRVTSGPPPSIQTFATDVHMAALETASSGVYPIDRMGNVSTRRRERFFEQAGNDYVVKPEVRSALTFARHNLLTDAPFTRVDLVSCRNLLIYFRTPAQERSISSMGFALRKGGVLFLGPSETLGFAAADYSPISQSWRLWRKESDQIERSYRRNLPTGTDLSVTQRSPLGTTDPSVLRAYDAILTEHFSAGVIINQRRELIYVMGSATSWLGYSSGRPTADTLSLITDPNLRLVAGATLRELESGAEVATPRQLGVSFTGPNDEPVALLGKRVKVSSDRFNYLLYTAPSFTSVSMPSAPLQLDTMTATTDEHVLALEIELRHTRESLQSSLEEQETSNEELNAANEELIASNEELQSTNEELSSVNEELRTLNDEHQRRLDQMLELSADLEQLMSSTEIGVVFLAEDASVRRFNEPARDYFRIRDNDVGRPFTDIVTSLSYPELHNDIQEAFDTGATSSRTIRNIALPDQRLLSQVTRYELPRQRWGVLIAIVNVSEVELADEERMLGAALRHVPAWFAIWDEGHRWTYANRPLGLTIEDPSQLVGKTYGDVYDAETAQRFEVENRQILDTGEPLSQLRAVNGETVITSKFRAVIDGLVHVCGLAISLQDVTGLPEMERALLIADTMEDLVTVGVLDADGELTWSTGLEGDDVPTNWLDADQLARFGLDPDSHREAFGRASRGTISEAHGRLVVDGVDERFVFSYVPARAQEESSRYLAGTVILRVLTSEAFERELDEKRRRVSELEADLMLLKESTSADVATLAERNEDLDNFAHVAAHDLKAPLRSIRSFAEMALEGIPADSSPAQQIEQVINSSKRMGNLIESLLEFAAIGREAVEPTEVDLTKLVDDITIDLRSAIDDRDAEMVIDLDSPHVHGNSDAIRQVLANLVNNSLKFSGDARTLIAIRSTADRNGIRIDVTDNGIGFPAEEADRLFEPFQRLHASPEPGSGVGLAICRRIVQRHGGKIWATSDPNGGATFSFWLPEPSAETEASS